jgi:hypothetical protein
MYASKLLNLTKKNYTIVEREALAMVYALHKLKHYLLGNWFVFYVDHMALVYFVNKTQVFSQITKWLLLFLEYNFKIIYKPSRSHLMVDSLSRFPNQARPIGVLDQTTNAHMFTLLPKWLQCVYEYLLEGVMLKIFTIS